MGKYMRKECRGVGELAVMEVTPVVGVRTRARTMAMASSSAAAVTSPKRRKRDLEASSEDMVQTSYLQLRSRSVVMTTRRARTPRNWPVVQGISQCSSKASSEVACEGCGSLENSLCYVGPSRERGESIASSELRSEAGDLESTAGVKSLSKRTMTKTESTTMMPTESEIEEFFVAAEREEKQRFAEKYNYDVINDVPLDGRYQWIPVIYP